MRRHVTVVNFWRYRLSALSNDLALQRLQLGDEINELRFECEVALRQLHARIYESLQLVEIALGLGDHLRDPSPNRVLRDGRDEVLYLCVVREHLRGGAVDGGHVRI